MQDLREKVVLYFAKEFKLLKEYKTQYGSGSSVYMMKADKITGAFELAQSLGLISYDEYTNLRLEYFHSK